MEQKKSKNHFYNPAGSFKKPTGSLKSLKCNWNWRFFDSDFLAQKIGTTVLWSKQNRWVVVGGSQK